MFAQTSTDASVAVGIEIRRIKTLPPMSEELQRLMQILRNENVTLDELHQAVENCPSLAARLLGLANSAYFGQAGNVHSIRQAVYQVLGLTMVKNLVYAQMLAQTLDTARCPAFRGERYWSASLLAAEYAQRLASYSRPAGRHAPLDGGVSHAAGLLAHIGILALVHTFPKEMDAVFRAAEKENDSVTRHLRERLGVEQYRVGAWLAARWHLPDSLVATLLALQAEAPIADAPTAGLVRLAHRLIRHSRDNAALDFGELAGLAGALGLEENKIVRVLEATEPKKQALLETAKLLVGHR